jgi:hypothetical protein
MRIFTVKAAETEQFLSLALFIIGQETSEIYSLLVLQCQEIRRIELRACCGRDSGMP